MLWAFLANQMASLHLSYVTGPIATITRIYASMEPSDQVGSALGRPKRYVRGQGTYEREIRVHECHIIEAFNPSPSTVKTRAIRFPLSCSPNPCLVPNGKVVMPMSTILYIAVAKMQQFSKWHASEQPNSSYTPVGQTMPRDGSDHLHSKRPPRCEQNQK